ncbi:Uncharacterized protein BWINRA5_04183 [Bacillus mycoides]|uniref:DUF6376 family protein n=1 Tax=Bacillus TaxID=1386 RepID=UPI0008180B77|nr:DUF6376 family protein [Bacillus mycoides]PEK87067.1 hypothetical protein CN600_28675 [Bacillus mycoides]QWG83352.1 hypothetical protein EXW61_07435 [Bacillus mycoides]QWH07652.1 hypothetical protein EXW49_18590 [Bacillus mycoides]SCB00746.1 Uncharacterized protein BWINRA5_04183 [Bacillus mycoides]
MKAMKLVFLALPLMLLGVGCAMPKDHLKESASQETVSETSTESSRHTTLNDKSFTYTNSLFDLSDELNKATSAVYDAVGDDNYKIALNALKKVTLKFEDLEPSDDYKDIHEKVLQSMKTRREGIELLLSNIDDKTTSDSLRGSYLLGESIDSYIDVIGEIAHKNKG